MRSGDEWCPVIDLDDGTILDWPEGITADIHYKVCDEGIYELLSEDMNVVTTKEGYVPSIMCPADNGYGDYVIMKIDDNGKIDKWRVDLSYWEK